MLSVSLKKVTKLRISSQECNNKLQELCYLILCVMVGGKIFLFKWNVTVPRYLKKVARCMMKYLKTLPISGSGPYLSIILPNHIWHSPYPSSKNEHFLFGCKILYHTFSILSLLWWSRLTADINWWLAGREKGEGGEGWMFIRNEKLLSG